MGIGELEGGKGRGVSGREPGLRLEFGIGIFYRFGEREVARRMMGTGKGPEWVSPRDPGSRLMCCARREFVTRISRRERTRMSKAAWPCPRR